MSQNTTITVAKGDGIGPEIMDATLQILKAGGARLDIEEIAIGESVYNAGNTAGIADESWESLKRTKVFLKAPITTPQGGGFKSLNVTVRKTLGLYANVRPCLSYSPFIETKHAGMDLVIVRENEEDTYGGIEHRQSDEVYQCLKLITRPGSERIARYAFEYARAYGRKKVTCFTKDNIMKMTDGLFHKVFEEVGTEYPDIEKEHWIVDIGAAKMADTPQVFDVVLLPNLYGDILSDVAAQIAGSVGLAGSANIGTQCAMFEAIHGSAPRRAGQNLANPSGLFLGAVQMLVHIGQGDVATKVHNAWLKTLEDGVHTYDVFQEGVSTAKVGTREFADAVCERIGQTPETLKAVDYSSANKPIEIQLSEHKPTVREQVGVDLFVSWKGTPDELAAKLKPIAPAGSELVVLSNRGQKVWPNGSAETFTVDVTRARFQNSDSSPFGRKSVIELLTNADNAGVEFVKTEGLFTFDGERGFSLAQGQ